MDTGAWQVIVTKCQTGLKQLSTCIERERNSHFLSQVGQESLIIYSALTSAFIMNQALASYVKWRMKWFIKFILDSAIWEHVHAWHSLRVCGPLEERRGRDLHESPHACVEGTAGRLSRKELYALCSVLSCSPFKGPQHLGSLVGRNIIRGVRGLLMNESVYERTGLNTFTFDPFPNPLDVYLGSSHFFIKFFFFLVGRYFLYDTVSVSAIHQHESVTGKHMSLPSWTSHPELLINCTSRLCHLLTWNFP